MIEKSIILSLQILAIYIAFADGMILAEVRIFFANIFDWMFGKKMSRMIQKPLWSCFSCMASVWTIILTIPFDCFSLPGLVAELKIILLVCAVNYIIGSRLINENES